MYSKTAHGIEVVHTKTASIGRNDQYIIYRELSMRRKRNPPTKFKLKFSRMCGGSEYCVRLCTMVGRYYCPGAGYSSKISSLQPVLFSIQH
ncbi:hypothetical protein GDO81_014489 [Engystomops pustulosus]|uniref:Uncharacterized protein n=1 Tax=Engystomops pustulosus TaxID=76066 RepID=A0AAV7BAW1_ENGPU|nr:hypothetical protein GDO81_014489 [Engystomops pustulosus]